MIPCWGAFGLQTSVAWSGPASALQSGGRCCGAAAGWMGPLGWQAEVGAPERGKRGNMDKPYERFRLPMDEWIRSAELEFLPLQALQD